MEYSDYDGFPAPLTNGGVNENHVAVRDVWAPSRSELVDMTPTPQKGVQYSDLARLVMQRAKTAHDGVKLIGQLIAAHDHATYGGNTHLIADPNEAWVVWEFAGGKGLWAAERIGPDDVKVLYPGYITKFPVDFQHDSDFMGSPNIVSFAREKGWFKSSAKQMDLFKVYGDQDPSTHARTGGFKYMSQAQLEDATRAMAPVSEEDLIARVRDPRISEDESGYGEVVSLNSETDPDLIRMWVAPTSSVTAPFVPWWLGVQEVPPEYAQHRYMIKGAGSHFLNPKFANQEASDFAGRRFKQVLYYTCSKPGVYLPIVQKTLRGFEAQSRADLPWVEQSARTLIANNQRERARQLLTFYSTTRADNALTLGATLVDALHAHAELITGIQRPPAGAIINNQNEDGEPVNCLMKANPDAPRSENNP